MMRPFNREDAPMLLLRLPLILMLLTASAYRAAAEVPDGTFLFNKRCALCHDTAALMPPLMKLPNDAERQAFLEKFLSRHHARDDEERKLIIDYLLKYQAH